ncbi:extracellular solute-binding protein [Paenibacillus flagellatus]|nr:extracellular solute-binding protein [Paenibacillus flagellatus]
MKKRSAVAVGVAGMMLIAACSDNNTQEPKKESDGQPAQTAVDPYRLPKPVDVKIVKAVLPDLKLPQGDTVENNLFSRHTAEKTNINFKLMWYASGQDYEQKYKLAIASNDLPDALIVDEKTFRSMAEGGQIEDLSKAYETYASPQLKEYYAATNNKALEKATIGGKLMALPNIVPLADSYALAWVRQDWLEKLGLKPPQKLDDLAAIAKAFIENDPDGNGKADTVGITGNNSTLASGSYTGGHDFKAVFNALGAFPGIWHKDKAGKLVYGSTTPEAKQAIAKVREWYAAGLIDKEFALRKNPDELVVGGRAGIFFGAWWAPWSPLGDAIKTNPKADWKPYLLSDANGQYNATMVPVSASFLVAKKGFAHPEALVVNLNFNTRFLRTPTDDDKKLDQTYVSMLPLDLTIDYPDTVNRKHDMLKQALEGKLSPDKLTPEMKGHYDRWQRDLSNHGANPGDWSAPYAYQFGAGAIVGKKVNEVFPVFTSSTKTMEKRWANLQKLETETFFKIVLGEQPLDAFDKFVQDWKSQGGDTIAQEIEAELK